MSFTFYCCYPSKALHHLDATKAETAKSGHVMSKVEWGSLLIIHVAVHWKKNHVITTDLNQ